MPLSNKLTPRPAMRPVALAAVLVLATQAHAQTPPAAADAAAAAGDGLKLDTIVITGSTVLRSKMKQSVSVSTVGLDQVGNLVASSATEVLRAVPGLRAESTGGEGNANLGVRGLPMSDGGGRYVQLQEDGLPILLFGDISFATADQFLRADNNLDSIDVLRGGSAATLSTNSPGAIVNFISRNGKTPGGSIGMSVGLDHRQQRVDYGVGTALGNKTWLHVGGFYRIGEGVRPTNVTAENGGQVKLSLLKEFDTGYVRFTFKQLDDKTPTYLPVPVRLNGNTIEQIPGVDPRTAFFINSNFAQDPVIDRNGNAVITSPADGLSVQVRSFGVEGQFKLGEGWSLTNRFRKSDIGGRFIGVFPAGSAPTDPANGANQYTGTTPAFSAHIFNTSLDDMGNVFNDLRLQKEIVLGAGSRLALTGGLFSGTQKIAQTWYWNRYNISLRGEGAVLLDNAGAQTNLPVAPGTLTWGGCCVRSFAYDITAVAPYAAASWELGALIVDASLRYDKQRGSGYYMEDVGTTGVWDRAVATRVNYSTDGSSYSLGANYEISKDMAAFGRASRGISWKSPDRVLGANNVARGIEEYQGNEVTQFEGGVKLRRGALSAFVTAFFAKTKEGAGFEVTTQTYKDNSYDSKGVEAELAWRSGSLRVQGGATFTKAEITSGANTGKTPRRQADLVYQVTPSYSLGALEFGGALVGTTKSYAQDDNQVVLPAYYVVNAFANYEFAPNTTFSLGVNNLFDKVGYTEAEGQGNLTNNALYIARSINGRSVRASLKYTF
ncbi:MAG: TonB-dependent receptor [Burkholderiales bacterium]|nr:TonB-dependent receptor [Burkholderiales bacterium]